MTSYHGGKQLIGKRLANIIVDESVDISEKEGWNINGYCEPFCGMLGVYQHIPKLYKKEGLTRLKYKAGDTNNSVVMMWEAAKNGWEPSTKVTTYKEFMKLKNDGKSNAKKGFVGHFYGFSGQYFQPFKIRNVDTLKKTVNNVCKIGQLVKKVSFSDGSYTQFSNLKNYVIYCDPPYQAQSHYYDGGRTKKLSFDHEKFWNWCRDMSEHNIVFVSEYKVPKDFEKIYSTNVKTAGSNRIDNLYIV
jgi:DNA adenine methylase